jgi:threonine/homoserine/homoserine lactone efflux protein
MLSMDTLLTFFAASVLLALAPGPDNIFVLTQSSVFGRRAGFLVTLGLCTGLIGHSMAVALGVAVIFQRSAAAFAALKYIGAGYLVYLAWQAFHASAARMQTERSGEAKLFALYCRGIIMNLTNPKVSIFFLAFLPQFADPSRGPISLQILLLGGVFIVSTILVFGGIALLAGTLGQWLHRSDRVQGIMNRIAGIVFVSLALKLATTKR